MMHATTSSSHGMNGAGESSKTISGLRSLTNNSRVIPSGTTTSTPTTTSGNNNNSNSNSNNTNTNSTAFTNTTLEYKLKQLQEDGMKYGTLLTQKLATSQSGQNLLHMGTSLSTLPPDVQNLIQQVQPIVQNIESIETKCTEQLQILYMKQNEMITYQHRASYAKQLMVLYQDLLQAEKIVKQQNQSITTTTTGFTNPLSTKNHDNKNDNHGITSLVDNNDDDDDDDNNHQMETMGSCHMKERYAMDIDSACSLERCAYITLMLLENLNVANECITHSLSKSKHNNHYNNNNNNTTTTTSAAEDSTEHAQFIVKLSPRIRRLESDTVTCLTKRMEDTLQKLYEYKEKKQQQQLQQHEQEQEQQQQKEEESNENSDDKEVTKSNNVPSTIESSERGFLSRKSHQNRTVVVVDGTEQHYILILGHIIRSMVLLNRSIEVETIFARTSILPLLRTKISMGILDEGGNRGECKGLTNLLKDIVQTISYLYSPFLRYVEGMFTMMNETHNNNNNNNNNNGGNNVEQKETTGVVDLELITSGVWVPIANVLMADNAIKMAIFSPGIASILQANYIALDQFIAQLAYKLLYNIHSNEPIITNNSNAITTTTTTDHENYSYCYQPSLTMEQIQKVQERIYQHTKTIEFYKKWNLPIYYQLRFGEFCYRLNQAIDKTQHGGWITSNVYTGPIETMEFIRNSIGFELGLFIELYDMMTNIWKPDIILVPLTNRFLRGTIQLIGRVITFVHDGMIGNILFGEEQQQDKNKDVQDNNNENTGTDTDIQMQVQTATVPTYSSRKQYCWGESEVEIAALAWELTILDSTLRHDYPTLVYNSIIRNHTTISSDDTTTIETDECENKELKTLIEELLNEASTQIQPIVDQAWNELVVKLLIAKCTSPLSAVKGVAATYRMTNRPPPTQASPFVVTILRPLKEFDHEFVNRIPDRIGYKWKQSIVVTIADRYADAVAELIATVQRTEEALKNRKARRTVGVGGTSIVAMSDGEKVKLQLYLDYVLFATNIRDVGIEPATIIGLSKLKELTTEGERLLEQQQQQQS